MRESWMGFKTFLNSEEEAFFASSLLQQSGLVPGLQRLPWVRGRDKWLPAVAAPPCCAEPPGPVHHLASPIPVTPLAVGRVPSVGC